MGDHCLWMRPINAANTQKSGNPANISTLGFSFVLHSCAVSCICACLTDRSGNGVIIAWCLNQLTVHCGWEARHLANIRNKQTKKVKISKDFDVWAQYRRHTMSKSVTDLGFPPFKMLAGFFRMRRRVKEKEKKQEASIWAPTHWHVLILIRINNTNALHT